MKANSTSKTYTATVYIWSRNGHTPLTNRGGYFCDELVKTEIEVSGPFDAQDKTRQIIRDTKHGHYGHCYLPEYENQNLRTHWIHA